MEETYLAMVNVGKSEEHNNIGLPVEILDTGRPEIMNYPVLKINYPHKFLW